MFIFIRIRNAWADFWEFMGSLVGTLGGCFGGLLRLIGILFVVSVIFAIPYGIYEGCNQASVKSQIVEATGSICECLGESQGIPDVLDSCLKFSEELELDKLEDDEYAKGLEKRILGESCGRKEVLPGWEATVNPSSNDVDGECRGAVVIDLAPARITVGGHGDFDGGQLYYEVRLKLAVVRRMTGFKMVDGSMQFVDSYGAPVNGLGSFQMDFTEREDLTKMLKKGEGDIWVTLRQTVGESSPYNHQRIDKVLSTLSSDIRRLSGYSFVLTLNPLHKAV